MEGIVHWDEVESRARIEGDIGGRWTLLGEAAGTVGVGLRRFRLDPGMRSTAVHVHGAEEEIFFVLEGSGLLWQGGSTSQVRAGDCIVHLQRTEAHTLRAGPDGLDAIVFGTRVPVEICFLPRAEQAWAGPAVVSASRPHDLWKDDAAAGPLEFPPAESRPPNVVNVEDVSGKNVERGRTRVLARTLGRAAGSRRTGLNHLTIAAGAHGWPPHCHSAEEEIFVVLDGEGICSLGDEDHAVRRGHVISRPPGTGVAHGFRAGEGPLTFLAYGTRETNDIAYYPRSGKIFVRGVGVIGRIEPLGYWNGEE